MSFLYFLESLRNPALDTFFSLITHLGSETLFMAIAITVFWCFNKYDGLYLLSTGFFGTLINQFLKLTCRVPRPWVKDPNFTIVESARADATGYSFPSGHTQSIGTSLGCPARFTKKLVVRIVCIALILLVGLSRMYLGVHTPADVLVSLGVSVVLVFGLYPVFQKARKEPLILYLVVGVLSALSLCYVLFVELNAWPADIDLRNLESGIKSGYLLLGCGAGMLVALPLERRFVKFKEKAPLIFQILKVVLGLGLVMAIKAGAKPLLNPIFNGHLASNAVRYFIIVIFAVLVWPMTFGWFAGGCKLPSWVKKLCKILLCVLMCILIAAGFIFWRVTRKTNADPISTDGAQNPFITSLGTTMLSNHRAGGDHSPENTMLAIRDMVEDAPYTVDTFEFDIHLTADGECVLLHDATLDRTSNSEEFFGKEGVRPENKTLAELRQLNMGEKFVDTDGTTPYKGLRGEQIPPELRITTLTEVLEYLEKNGDYTYVIEIKSSGKYGKKAADKLYDTLKTMDILDKAVVGTFHNEITAYMDRYYPDMLRSAGVSEAIEFYICSFLGLKREKSDFGFDALQIPTTDYVVNLGTSKLINYAHKHDIAVQYWTINDKEEMEYLQSIGADMVMTDRPDIGAEILNRP